MISFFSLKPYHIFSQSSYKNAAGLFLLSLTYNTLVLFYEYLPTGIISIVSLIYILLFINKAKKYYTLTQSIFLLTISLVPSSFVSVMGTSYETLPLSWFSLAVLALIFATFRQRKIAQLFVFSLLLFALFALYSLVIVEHPGSAIKQIINISFFLVSFIIGVYLSKHQWTDLFSKMTKIVYVQTTIIFGAVILLQKVFIENTGYIVGNYGEYALGRISFAGLMGDFSFASLYVATGLILLFYLYKNKDMKHIFSLIAGSSILLASILAINARTGLLAITAAIVIGIVIEIAKGSKKAIIVGLFLIIVLAYIAQAIYIDRGNQQLTDGSSRGDEYSAGIEVFLNHPILGIGLGDQEYKKYLGDNPLPHNFFIQYLMQTGIVGLTIILSNFLFFFRLPIYRDTGILLTLIAIFIGAMVIPDIFNSRYFFIIIVISIIACGKYIQTQKEGPVYG